MAKIHILTAQIALAGDITNVAHRSASNPVTYPELLVLEEIHGEGSIRECTVIGEQETTAVAEKSRLLQRYGAVVEQVYPGRSPQMEMIDPTYKPAKADKADKPVKADKPAKGKKADEDKVEDEDTPSEDTTSGDAPATDDPFAI